MCVHSVCGCVCVCVCVCVYHSFFIHSSVDGHLGCFHILATVNNTANEHWDACIFSIGYLSKLKNKTLKQMSTM